MEPIYEMTLYPDLYRNTSWGVHPWKELEPYWADALDLIENRDAFARSWDIDFVQPLNWDGEFETIKHIECYRPYKSHDVEPYLGVIHLEKKNLDPDFDFMRFGLIPWAGAIYNKNYTTFCVIKDTEQDLYDLIYSLDQSFVEVEPEIEPLDIDSEAEPENQEFAAESENA